MSIFMNAFPLIVPNQNLDAIVIPYERKILTDLQNGGELSPPSLRRGNSILVFSNNKSAFSNSKIEYVNLSEDYSIFCFLVKEAIKKYLSKINRLPIGFHPVEFSSNKAEEELIGSIVGQKFPFKIFPRYDIDTRIINGIPHLVINCSTRRVVTETCKYFLENGMDLVGRFVVAKSDSGLRIPMGEILSTTDNNLIFQTIDGTAEHANINETYLDASRENFDDYISLVFGDNREFISEKIRIRISIFNGGENKKKKIDVVASHFKTVGITIFGGSKVVINSAADLSKICTQMEKPVFIFNDNGQDHWPDRGLNNFGPYTKRTFDRNDPSICIICSEHDKGSVEQFVRKFLKGIPNHKYFGNGLEGKFNVGTSTVEVVTTPTNDTDGYKLAIEKAIKKKAESGEKWDLALVQVRQSFKKLSVSDNPYYIGKSLFFLHQIPVQDFTIELLAQLENNLGYSLNNMALASYAKMGGVPWLLKSSPTLSHELVIGIGSANISVNRRKENRRIMGITTVFSGDGSYIVSSTSKAVIPEEYCNALTTTLSETIEKVQKRMNWQKGDTIRLIFHASVKRFNKEEVDAVREVVSRYKEYQIEYSFLKVSEDHGLHLFDTSTAQEAKGRLAPKRGKTLKLSNYEMLIYLIGHSELKQKTDGHPRGIILSIHRDSTFKDIKYLSSQLFNFSAHSWRSYFPNPMPVTISYSDLIARNLGWLNELPGWNDTVMIGKIGQSQWFL